MHTLNTGAAHGAVCGAAWYGSTAAVVVAVVV